MEKPFARNPQYWQQMGWGVLMALLGALGTLAFAILMTLGLSLLWSWLDPNDVQAFSGNWQIVAIMTGAGLIVGFYAYPPIIPIRGYLHIPRFFRF